MCSKAHPAQALPEVVNLIYQRLHLVAAARAVRAGGVVAEKRGGTHSLGRARCAQRLECGQQALQLAQHHAVRAWSLHGGTGDTQRAQVRTVAWLLERRLCAPTPIRYD